LSLTITRAILYKQQQRRFFPIISPLFHLLGYLLKIITLTCPLYIGYSRYNNILMTNLSHQCSQLNFSSLNVAVVGHIKLHISAFILQGFINKKYLSYLTYKITNLLILSGDKNLLNEDNEEIVSIVQTNIAFIKQINFCWICQFST